MFKLTQSDKQYYFKICLSRFKCRFKFT